MRYFLFSILVVSIAGVWVGGEKKLEPPSKMVFVAKTGTSPMTRAHLKRVKDDCKTCHPSSGRKPKET